MFLVLLTFDEMISRVESGKLKKDDTTWIILYIVEFCGCLSLSFISCCQGGESYRLKLLSNSPEDYNECVDNMHGIAATFAILSFGTSNFIYLLQKFSRSNLTLIGTIVGVISIVCFILFMVISNWKNFVIKNTDVSKNYILCGKNIKNKDHRCCCFLTTYVLEVMFFYLLVVSYAIFSIFRNDHFSFMIDHGKVNNTLY